jgi:hypothetical protein
MIEKSYFFAVHGALLEVTPEPTFGEDTVSLHINKDYLWTPECIAELRKFLKKLQKQLEGSSIE